MISLFVIKKIMAAGIFLAGILMAWFGMLYAFPTTSCFRPTGILVAVIGYSILPLAVQIYENVYDAEKNSE